jgi:hypothetical protein
MENMDSESTHRYTLEPTILRITKIYRRQAFIFKNTSTSNQHVLRKITYLTIISTTEEYYSLLNQNNNNNNNNQNTLPNSIEPKLNVHIQLPNA